MKIDKIWAVIPARGGSKGLPKKNVALLGGKPLISYSIEAALAAKCVCRTLVTTDDPEIAAVARAAGAEVPFLRPKDLATDKADLGKAVYHFLDTLAAADGAPDGFVLLYPTHPFRTPKMIDRAVEELQRHVQVSSAVETAFQPHRLWYSHGGRRVPLSVSPYFQQVYRPTGTFIAMAYFPPEARNPADPSARSRYSESHRDRFGKGYQFLTWFYVLRHPAAAIDIDTADDLIRAEQMIRSGRFDFTGAGDEDRFSAMASVA